MGSVALLTRESRSRSPSASRRRAARPARRAQLVRRDRGILNIGDKLRKNEIRVKEVVKDADEEDEELDEEWHIQRACKLIDKVRLLWKSQATLTRSSTRPAPCHEEEVQKQVEDSKHAIPRRSRRSASRRSRSTRSSSSSAVRSAHRPGDREITDREQKSGLS